MSLIACTKLQDCCNPHCGSCSENLHHKNWFILFCFYSYINQHSVLWLFGSCYLF